ncbi:tautomerase family protein [Priestia taiwanensis]|uniref:Tautomerase n=1 Tax=Priestia taiwanensis TaxID=1347902 RepID=A0A917ELP8_9BACI|nr:tautomerase family protein [Priestia taiwanensis]MBM7362270.1 4-oxalocrotonate tautomerase [Priestia taiwanensis]GGE60855.1 tautomerase [Priestia taiwanensis]
MPVIHIHMLEGRSEDQIIRFMEEITCITVERLKVKEDQVRIIIHEIPPSRWAVAGQVKVNKK